MGHCVQLVIGRGEALTRFMAAWPGTEATELLGGWSAVPVSGPLFDGIQSKHVGCQRDPAFDVSPCGLEAELAAATKDGGALAYVETDYFGGAGDQSAGAWVDGEASSARARGIGAINAALKAIGVERSGSNDAFDTIGLGLRRGMDGYGVAHDE